MFLLKRKQSPVLDIDISLTSVKLLDLSRNKEGLRVENHAAQPLPPNAIAKEIISNADAIGDANRKAIKRTGTKNKHCALAVTGSALTTKIITMLMGLENEEMEAQIQLKSGSIHPISLTRLISALRY